MRRRSAVVTTVLSLVGVVLVGACTVPGPTDAYPTDGPSASSTGATPSAPPPYDGPILGGDYTLGTMGEYVDTYVETFVLPWLMDTWPSQRPDDAADYYAPTEANVHCALNHGQRVVCVRYVPIGDVGDSGCGDGAGGVAQYDENAYFYCSPDLTVYLGQQQLWHFYTATGDAGPVMGIAHEFGHHVQTILDVPQPRSAAGSVEFENQADCLSGTWARYAAAQGWLDDPNRSPDDPSPLEDIELIFPIIADLEGSQNRTHGTQDEREQAFTAGYLGGVRACGLTEG